MKHLITSLIAIAYYSLASAAHQQVRDYIAPSYDDWDNYLIGPIT